MNKYLLLYHEIYAQRVLKLLNIVEQLHGKLPRQEYVKHPVVKLLARLLNATSETIPQDPNNRDYLLKNNLSKFRRYKAGLQRYRVLFCFSNTPNIIVYFYINDADHLRKDGDKNEPYREFEMLVKRGVFSHKPDDEKMQQCIRRSI